MQACLFRFADSRQNAVLELLAEVNSGFNADTVVQSVRFAVAMNAINYKNLTDRVGLPGQVGRNFNDAVNLRPFHYCTASLVGFDTSCGCLSRTALLCLAICCIRILFNILIVSGV